MVIMISLIAILSLLIVTNGQQRPAREKAMDLRFENFVSLESAAKNAVSRQCFIGGSDARIIMGADEAALIRLWREKRGELEPEDLSGNLIVQLGAATEPLNRAWYQRNTGRTVNDVQR